MKKETKERNPLLKGQKFGKLTVIELDHIEKHKRKDGQKENFYFYKFQCDCGNIKIINKKKCNKRSYKILWVS